MSKHEAGRGSGTLCDNDAAQFSGTYLYKPDNHSKFSA
jgi:hypothetical protein